jgi:predicted permease
MGFWTDRIAAIRRRLSHTEDERAREMQLHVELEIEEQMAEGKTPREARTAALRAMGNMTLAREDVRNLSPWAWCAQVRQDIRYGLRTFWRSPAFALTAVLTIALGVGANAAMFSIVDALLLRSLPVSRPEELVVIDDPENGNFSYPDFVALRNGNSMLTELMAASSQLRALLNVDVDSETSAARLVSGNYFTTLGVRPAFGRLLAPADERAPVAVISYGFWTRRFGQSRDVIGKVVTLNGVAITLVGVAPKNFFGETPGESPDIWASMAVQRTAALNEPGFSWLYLMGRLKPGVSPAQAQAQLSPLFAAAASDPSSRTGARIEVSAGARGVSRWRQRVGGPLQALMVLVGLMLLIACANLATLLLTRGTARRREIAMRLAIGASRFRVVRQLMTETLLLCAAGGVLSVAFAVWGSGVMVRMASAIGTGADLRLAIGADARLLGFIALTSIATGLIFGLLPAIREVRNAARAMAGSDGRVVGAEREWVWRGALIVIQVALALVLLAGSVMFLRTLRNLESQDLGFRADGLLQVEIDPERGYRAPTSSIARLVERTAAIPGVQSATAVFGGTLANIGGVRGLQFEGFVPRDDQDRHARADWVGPAYFRTAGIPLIAGRDFLPTDDERAARAAIVNQAAARHYFGSDAAALAKRFIFNGNEYEIVGVGGNAKYADLREQTPRMIYFPLLQGTTGMNALEIRSARSDTAALTAGIRQAVREIDPRLRVGQTLTLSDRVERTLGREHLLADLSGFFGTVTLLLVSVGIYGTLAYTAGRRTKEIGLRLALGARRGAVVWLVFRQIAIVMCVGVALGVMGGLAVGRLVRSMLFGLQPTDPITFVSAAVMLIGVALAAGLVPAWRASRLDPAVVLRE